MRAIGGRVARLAGVVVVVTAFTALLTSLIPGDPVDVLLPYGSEQQHAELRQELKLDEPVTTRYIDWLVNAATGDLGDYYSTSSSRPVAGRIAETLPVTLQLVLYAQAIALLLAVPLAVLAASRPSSWLDKLATTSSFGLMAVPNFALGLLAAYYIGVKLRWLPPSGYTPIGDGIGEHLRTMVLPSVTLGVGHVAIYFRLLRSDLIATLKEDFILFARAQGFSPRRILWRHALRPSTLTLLTVVGINMGLLIGSAVTLEVVFSIPGIGLLIFDAIRERQYVALQGAVAVVAMVYVLINFATDLGYQWLDPRIRHGAGA